MGNDILGDNVVDWMHGFGFWMLDAGFGEGKSACDLPYVGGLMTRSSKFLW